MRAVVNGTTIFDLKEKEPVVINCTTKETVLYITNGFQSSGKMKLRYEAGSNYFFQVNAVVDNLGMLIAVATSLLLFVSYIFSEIKMLLILANIPVLVLVYFFFIHPKGAIVLKNWTPARPPTKP